MQRTLKVQYVWSCPNYLSLKELYMTNYLKDLTG